MGMAFEVGDMNINRPWITLNLCVSRSVYFSPALSANLTPVRTVKKLGDCQTAGSAQGKEEMPARVNKLHCRIQSWKITKQLLQSFYHIWFFFSPWPRWTLQKWEVLKGKPHMLALLSTDCDVDGKCSLVTSWYTPALVNMLQWALLPRLEQEGKTRSICSQTGSLVVLKSMHLVQCLIFPPEWRANEFYTNSEWV